MIDSNIKSIVETGTYLAQTTIYFARFGFFVYSIELNKKLYIFSKYRVRNLKNVFLINEDSSKELFNICNTIEYSCVFF